MYPVLPGWPLALNNCALVFRAGEAYGACRYINRTDGRLPLLPLSPLCDPCDPSFLHATPLPLLYTLFVFATHNLALAPRPRPPNTKYQYSRTHCPVCWARPGRAWWWLPWRWRCCSLLAERAAHQTTHFATMGIWKASVLLRRTSGCRATAQPSWDNISS